MGSRILSVVADGFLSPAARSPAPYTRSLSVSAWLPVSVKAVVAPLMVLLASSPAVAQSSLPDHRLTPGAVNPSVTNETMRSTICVRGWTRSMRPDAATNHRMKQAAMVEYGLRGQRLSNYEGDHLVPLALGGAPSDMRNYWAEPLIAGDGCLRTNWKQYSAAWYAPAACRWTGHSARSRPTGTMPISFMFWAGNNHRATAHSLNGMRHQAGQALEWPTTAYNPHQHLGNLPGWWGAAFRRLHRKRLHHAALVALSNRRPGGFGEHRIPAADRQLCRRDHLARPAATISDVIPTRRRPALAMGRIGTTDGGRPGSAACGDDPSRRPGAGRDRLWSLAQKD